MSLKKISLFSFISISILACHIFAETVYLKNSRRAFEGEIIEKTKEFIRLDTGEGVVKILFSSMDEATRQRIQDLEINSEYQRKAQVKEAAIKERLDRGGVVLVEDLSADEKAYADEHYRTLSTVRISFEDENYYDKALSFAQQGDLPAAVEHIDLALAQGKDTASLHRFKGDILHELGKLQESIESYTNALRLDPSMSDAYCNRGHAYFLLQDFSRAVDDYTKGLDINGENWRCLENRANAYLLKGDLDDAQKDFEQLQAVDSIYAQIGLGNICLARNDAERALQYYHKVIETVPNAGEVYANMGIAYFNLGQVDKAKIFTEKAKTLGIAVSEEFQQQLITGK